MFHVNEQNQEGKYGQLARKLLKIATISGSKVVLRHADQSSDISTELLHEFGTTDVAIGDVTAEVMITTLGKIPSEMYYLEDTTPNTKLTSHKHNLLQQTPHYGHAVEATTDNMKANDEYTGHSSVLLILLIVLLVILLLCCISACLIAKTRRKTSFFGKSDMECDPKCTGISQPLLDKSSESTHKTSISSLKN